MKNLVLNLGRIDQTNSYRIYVTINDKKVFAGALPDNFRVISRSFRNRLSRLFFQQCWLPAAAGAWNADVVHSPSFIMPYFRGRQKHLLTVQDMTFFTVPHYHNRLRKSRLFRSMVLKSILSSNLVHVPSESTKKDLLKLLPQISSERIQVVPYAASEEFRVFPEKELDQKIKELDLPERYILYVGTIEPRKNLLSLIESYRKLLEKGISEDLVLAGARGWEFDEVIKIINDPELKDKVHMPGYVSQKDLPYVYAGARLFVYPSLYEGFGLPPIEAMACGTPVITSPNSSLLEYYKDTAIMVPADDLTALSNAMVRMLSNESLRAEYRSRGLELASEFSWTNTAAEILKCYKSLASGRLAK